MLDFQAFFVYTNPAFCKVKNVFKKRAMKQSNEPKSDREYYLFASKIVGDVTGTIAAPAVLFALLGRYLDNKFGTGPLFLLLGLVLAFTASAISIYRKSKRYGKEYQAITSTPKKDTTQK